MPVKHAFTSAKSDGGDATLVRPSDWNAGHVTPYAAGTFTVATGNANLQVKRLQLTGSQRMTLEGTARLRIL
jgi:methionyl-tRNA formyltransferase